MIELSELEKEVVGELRHSVYTVEFLEEWINRNDNPMINATAALQAMGAKGFYEAVKMIAAQRDREAWFGSPVEWDEIPKEVGPESEVRRVLDDEIEFTLEELRQRGSVYSGVNSYHAGLFDAAVELIERLVIDNTRGRKLVRELEEKLSETASDQ